jgi:hypothetical protein
MEYVDKTYKLEKFGKIGEEKRLIGTKIELS